MRSPFRRASHAALLCLLGLESTALAQAGPPRAVSPNFTALGPSLTVGGARLTGSGRVALALVGTAPDAGSASSPGFRLDGVPALGPVGTPSSLPFLAAVQPPVTSGLLPAQLELIGSGFSAPGAGPANLSIDGGAPIPVTVIDDGHALATPPSGLDAGLNPLGPVELEYSNANGAAQLDDALVFGPAIEFTGPLHIGQTVDLVCHGPAGELFLVYFSKGLLPGPIPLAGLAGSLAVLPSEKLLLTVASSGSTTSVLPVVDNTAFIGVTRALQAVTLGSPEGLRFTNAFSFTFLP